MQEQDTTTATQFYLEWAMGILLYDTEVNLSMVERLQITVTHLVGAAVNGEHEEMRVIGKGKRGPGSVVDGVSICMAPVIMRRAGEEIDMRTMVRAQ